MSWQTQQSQTIHENHIQEFKVDSVKLPNGENVEYGYISKKFPTAVIIAENSQQQIALVQIYRYPNDITIWQIPCENGESGEEDIHAAVRGSKEELHIYPEVVEKIGEFYIDPGTVKQTAKVYLVTQLEPLKDQVQTDNTEQAEIKTSQWFSLKQILSMIKNGEIKDGWTITAINYYQIHRHNHGQ